MTLALLPLACVSPTVVVVLCLIIAFLVFIGATA